MTRSNYTPGSTVIRCTKCDTEYPATTEFFYTRKQSPSGFTSRCKKCIDLSQSEYGKRPEVRERERERRRKTRDEYNRKKREDRAANPEKYRKWQREWEAKNLQRRREQNRKGGQVYAKSHSLERQVSIHHRRARKLGLPTTFTANEWRACLEYWHHTCAVCGRPAGFWHTLAIEHWIPLSSTQENNPGNVRSNIVPLCHGVNGCNNSKGTHDPADWLTRKFGKRKANQILKRIKAYFDQLE